MSRGPVIEQQQPRHVEAQEYQNGQQDGLDAQHGQSASKGQDRRAKQAGENAP
jgi:hypothetical protein